MERALERQAEKLNKEEVILRNYLEGVPTDQVEDMLELMQFERALLMMQYTSRMNVISSVLKKRALNG